jgi:fatty acid desaturase
MDWQDVLAIAALVVFGVPLLLYGAALFWVMLCGFVLKPMGIVDDEYMKVLEETL